MPNKYKPMVWLVILGTMAACQITPPQKAYTKYFGTVIIKSNQAQLKSNVVVYENPTGIIIQLIKPIVGKIADIKLSSGGNKVVFVESNLDFPKALENSLEEDKGFILKTLSNCLTKDSVNKTYQNAFVLCSKGSDNSLMIRFNTTDGFYGDFNLKLDE